METPYISSPGKGIVFTETVISVRRAAAELTAKGIDKIILFSHQGCTEDLQLAPLLSGIDVIVGGHSHTLLGDFTKIRLASAGPYPTKAQDQDGGTVLVVHANEWGKIRGDLRVTFDPQGAIQSWRAAPRAVTGKQFFRVYDVPSLGGEPKRVQFTRDPTGTVGVAEYDGKAYGPVTSPEQEAAKLAGYATGVNQLKGQVIAQAGEDLVRKLNSGTGPIIADGMAWKTGAQIAINNPGGVRININQGPISVATVYELLPLRGAEVVKVLEDGVDFQVSRYGTDPNNPYVYVAGVAFTLEAAKSKGLRIQNVRVKSGTGSYAPIDPEAVFKVVVNNFMVAGGDRYDTGINDAEVFMEYIKGKTLVNLAEEQIEIEK